MSIETVKGSANIHDHIDRAIKSDVDAGQHDSVPEIVDQLAQHPDTDKSHMHKVAEHLMSHNVENKHNEWQRKNALSTALSHGQTEAKTVNSFLDNFNANPLQNGSVDVAEDALNKIGVDQGKLVQFLSKKIEQGNAEPYGANSDVLHELGKKAQSAPQEDIHNFHSFVTSSYSKGPRDQSDYDKMKPMVHAALKDSDTPDEVQQDLFGHSHDVSHNDLMEMYHQIPAEKHKYDPGTSSKIKMNLMNHPNVNKDFVAAAALDTSNDFHKQALQSKNLPAQVVDRLISNNDTQSLQHVMDSKDLAPEIAERVAEYGVGKEGIQDEYESFLNVNAKKLSQPVANKLYSAFRGTGQDSYAQILAESPNSSDETFMDSVNRGENPSIYDRKITPELANSLSNNDGYQASLIRHDEVPEDIKVKIAESGKLPYKEAIGRYGNIQLPFAVNKAYLKGMMKNNKLNADLMSSVFHDEKATAEDKASIMDAAVKGFKSKAKSKASSSFFADGLSTGSKEIKDQFDNLVPKHQASVLNSFTEKDGNRDFLRDGLLSESTIKHFLENPDLTDETKKTMLQNPNVSVETFIKSVPHTDIWHQMSKNVDTINSKISALPSDQRTQFLNKMTDENNFHNLSKTVREAIVTNPDANIQGIQFNSNEIKDIASRLGDNLHSVVNKMTPDQATDFFGQLNASDMKHADWSSMSEHHPEPVIDYLARISGHGNFASRYMDDSTAEVHPQIIDKILQSPKMTGYEINNVAKLYDPDKDPGHQRLKNIFSTYGYNRSSVVDLFNGMRDNSDLKSNKEALSDIGRDFAPGGPLENPHVWEQISESDHLPDSLKEIASYSSPKVASKRLAHVQSTKGKEAEKQLTMEMASNPNTTPDVYAGLLENMEVMRPDKTEINHDQHVQETLNMALNGLKTGKLNTDNDVVHSITRSLSNLNDDNYKHSTVLQIVDAIQNSSSITNSGKVYGLSQIVKAKIPEATKHEIANHIIDSAISSDDYQTIGKIGSSSLAYRTDLWTPKKLDSVSYGAFLDVAHKMLGSEGDKTINPQNWLLASKSLIDNIGVAEFNQYGSAKMGEFVSAGIKDENTNEVANLMIKAMTTKLSTDVSKREQYKKNSEFQAFFNQLENMTEVVKSPIGQKAMLSFFEGIQGPISIDIKDPSMFDMMRNDVTNQFQAAVVVENGSQDRRSTEDLLKYSDMVTNKSKLGGVIAKRLNDNHPFLDQEEAVTILGNLATKDPTAFSKFMKFAPESTVSSMKMLSAVSISIPKAADTLIATNDPDPENFSKGMFEFSREMFNSGTTDVKSEDVTVARNHFVGQMADSLIKLVQHGNQNTRQKNSDPEDVQQYDNSSLYGNITEDLKDAFPYSVNVSLGLNTDKFLALSVAISEDEGMYSTKDGALGTVNHVIYTRGSFDSQKLHSILSENPSAVFSAIKNKDFSIDHLQHYQPDQFLAAMKMQPYFDHSKLKQFDATNSNFFDSLRLRKDDFGDEDKTLIAKKGFEYLTSRSVLSNKYDDTMSLNTNLFDVAKNMLSASKTPTQQEEVLNHIVAHADSHESIMLLLASDLNADQTHTALNKLGPNGMYKKISDSSSDATEALENINFNKESFSEFKKQTDLKGLEVITPILNNTKIKDLSVKHEAIDGLVDYIEQNGSKHLMFVINSALTVPGISKNQYDYLIKHIQDNKKVEVFNDSVLGDSKQFMNPDFGGDSFRDLGITNSMKKTFKQLTKTNFDGDVAKFHYGKDLDSFNQLLGMVPPAGLSWKDFKRANPKLAENPKIKNLFMGNKETVTPDIVTQGMSTLPGSYHITFAKWDGIQKHSDKDNLVVQFNTDKSFENRISQDPALHDFFINMCYEGNTGGHPVTPRSLFWSRIDTSSKKGWIIEEIQSDFDSTLRSILNNSKTKSTVEINGKSYKREDLEKFFKSFSKIIADHTDVAHKYIEKLAKQQGVNVLHMHGMHMRAGMSGMGDHKEVPKWLEYKYETYPKNNGWAESSYDKYPSKNESGNYIGKQTWIKKLT